MNKELLKLIERLGLKETKVDFDFHLDENDVIDVERIDESIRIIEIPQTIVEFGFETEIDDKEMVSIHFGFGGLKLSKKALKQAYDDWWMRDTLMEMDK